MTLIIYALMLFIVAGCVLKLSLWPWRGRLAFSAVVAAFVECAREAAMSQSKTQIADFLQDTPALQDMAVIVSIETAVCFAFAICWLQGVYGTAAGCRHTFTGRPAAAAMRRLSALLLRCYPSLLVFPVAFFLLTQTMFTAVGVDFGLTTHIIAAAMLIGLPLLAEAMCRLMPQEEGRVELLLIVACFVCVLGLASTESSRMVYKVKETAVDTGVITTATAVFALLFAAGAAWERVRWRVKNNLKK